MALIDTEGLILKSYNLADADKIVVFFTRKDGLVRGVAKGAKRLTSKFGSSLEPFSIVYLTYIQKEERELVSIQQSELKRSFFSEASEPKFLQKFGYLFDLLTQFVPPHDPNERLYKMAKACLGAAVQELDGLDSIVFYFEFWLLKLGGYLPGWEACGNCNRVLEEQDSVVLQPDLRLLCLNCAEDRRGWEINSAERALFLKAQTVAPAKFINTTANRSKDLGKASEVLKRIISKVLDREVVDGKAFSFNL